MQRLQIMSGRPGGPLILLIKVFSLLLSSQLQLEKIVSSILNFLK